jgi:TnpA family transposase
MTLISVLSKAEAKEFDEPPVFNSIDRKRFYNLNVTLQNTIDKLRTPTNKVCFLTSYAYFKAQKRFYDGKFQEQDINYACRILNIDIDLVSLKSYSRKTRLDHQLLIMNILGYVHFNNSANDSLNNLVYQHVKSYKSPRLIFAEMVDYLLLHKIVIPRYRQFANIISAQLHKYKLDINECLTNCLDEQIKCQLDDLLHQSDDNQYTLRFLKHYNQSLQPGNIRNNLQDFNRIKSLYSLVKRPFTALDLNHEGAMYLTRFVERNRSLHLSQRIDSTRYVSLIAFIAYQYFQGHDILAEILLQSTQTVKNSVNEQLKTERAENYTEQNRKFHSAVVQAKSCLASPLEQISSLVFDNNLTSKDCLAKIRKILLSKKLPIEECHNTLSNLEKSLQPDEQDNTYFSILESKSRKLQNRIGGIIKSINFTGDKELIKAIHNFQTRDTFDARAPIGFLSEKERKQIMDNKNNLRVLLYKALLFLKVAWSLKSGKLSIPYSYKYRDINDYLIPLEQWNAKRDDYIKQASLEDFVDIEKLLSEYKTEMKESFAKVNNLILKEKTPYITTRPDGSFILRTPKLEEKETHSISSILPHKKDIPIQNVLSVIASQTGFPKYFLHDTPSMQHRNPENNTLFATLMSYGCNVGIPRMARITKGQSQSALENIARQYMHIDNIKRANDSVIKKIDEVSDYFIISDLRHTSSDGQKYNIDGCSLNANYSFKYFGKGQGVSSYTFVDDRFAHFYATVISSSEREATYVLDGIMHNQVVKSDIHSTDSHGLTEAMFGLMHMTKITFAPRFKNLSDQTLYGLKSTKVSKNDFIVPKKYIKSELITQNYDDILRFAATIKLRYAPASQLFKRLNSYSKQHVLYRALKEFGRLRKTMFILRYMYDIEFRQAIEKQLNRGENSNKFSKAVAFGNNQEIIFEEKEDQEIAENCRQLIKNCIILWNYLYLIKMLQSDDQTLAQYALIVLQKGNVLAWKHILLHGEYDLSIENTNDEFGLMDPKIIALIYTKFWET